MPLTDVQYVLGHAQLTTTQIYLTPRKEDVIERMLAHHAEQTRKAAQQDTLPAARLSTRDAGCAVRPEALMTIVETIPVTRAATRVDAEPVESASRQPDWRTRYPARAVGTDWPATCGDRAEVDRVVAAATAGLPTQRVQEARRWGVPLLLDWLADQPGETWQQRWVAGGADAAGGDWAQHPEQWLRREGIYSENRLQLLTSSLLVVVGADVVRPSLAWLLTGGKKRKLVRNMVYGRDGAGFDRLRRLCEQDPAIRPDAVGDILFRSAVIVAAKGGMLEDITVGDVLEILDAEYAMSGPRGFGVGDLPNAPGGRSSRREHADAAADPQSRPALARAAGRPLSDRVSPDPRPARRLLGRTATGGRLHHAGRAGVSPGAVLLVRSRAASSRPRLATSAARGRRRVETPAAHQDHHRHPRRRTRRGRIRTPRLPRHAGHGAGVLPRPGRMGTRRPGPVGCVGGTVPDQPRGPGPAQVRAPPQGPHGQPHPRTAAGAARAWSEPSTGGGASRGRCWKPGNRPRPGKQFTAAGKTLIRIDRPTAAADNVWARDPDTGKPRLLNLDEEHAFWAWAVIEVLRHTGVRVEELLELSHHSLIQYRLPSTGELVPLLQIAPSKTDTERLLVVGPELADVLSAVICRVRGADGAVPLVCARDSHELVWLPPSPLLFQRRTRTENRSLGGGFVARLLDEALAHTGLTDPAGEPLHFTAHDFRRMFITDAVLNGLPPHIAQVIAGHRDISVTMGYKAVYPDEAITAHLAFIARRRALRPTEEYRQPTDEEWQQFLGHFERRKVSVGTCGRAFGTPCIHEHACVRCALLWPDPQQRSRLQRDPRQPQSPHRRSRT